MRLQLATMLVLCALLSQSIALAAGGYIGHPSMLLYSQVSGDAGGNPIEDRGYFGPVTGIVSYPGVFAMDPGGPSWLNYITAAQSGLPYQLENVALTRTVPVQSVFRLEPPPARITQSGEGIRLWWPLTYELPSTTFTLALTYLTDYPVKLTGETAAFAEHSETWVWQVATSTTNLYGLLGLFHDLPAGPSDTPLLADDGLYYQLQADLARVDEQLSTGDPVALNNCLGSFEARVRASEALQLPALPGPTCGTINMPEDPAVSMLVASSDVLRPRTVGSLEELAAGVADGALVSITSPQTVTLTGSNWCYVQNDSRTVGMKVTGITGVHTGTRVALSGALKSSGPERVLTASKTGVTVVVENGPAARPLYMPIRSVGGCGNGSLSGFTGTPGLWNGGLLISVTGKVTGAGAGYFYIDDGSGSRDITTNRGLRIILPTAVTVPPATGSYVVVTGISSSFAPTAPYNPLAAAYWPAVQMSDVRVL